MWRSKTEELLRESKPEDNRKEVPITVPVSTFLTAPSPLLSGVPFLLLCHRLALSLPLALLLRPLTFLLLLMLVTKASSC